MKVQTELEPKMTARQSRPRPSSQVGHPTRHVANQNLKIKIKNPLFISRFHQFCTSLHQLPPQPISARSRFSRTQLPIAPGNSRSHFFQLPIAPDSSRSIFSKRDLSGPIGSYRELSGPKAVFPILGLTKPAAAEVSLSKLNPLPDIETSKVK